VLPRDHKRSKPGTRLRFLNNRHHCKQGGAHQP
jgi:hypothetical protein